MHRLPPLPAVPRPPVRPPFPVIAVVAPLVGAVVIGLVTASPFVLLFAVLSPLIAIATVLDGRRHARRTVRDEAARFARECGEYEHAVLVAHAQERAELDARHPLGPAAEPDELGAVRLGTAPAPSTTAPDAPPSCGDPAVDERLRGLLDRARRHPALPVFVPRGPLVLQGRGAVAESLARRLQAEPGVALERVDPADSCPATATVLRVHSATRVELNVPGREPVSVRPELASVRQLDQHAASRTAAAGPPPRVAWSDLACRTAAEPVEGVPIGLDGTGAVGIDLERGGPHALVGGTTGSGKSEFLRALALGWAARHPPSAVHLLLVDFKGGATFAALTQLPHVVGLVTDLDPLVAQRTLLSLRAELRRRERVLVEAGLRDVAQRPDVLARLVVLVDEFAALIDDFPELHAPFADLSARGRSLGVHLVLGTQHPAGAVRDAVAANCAVRIAFRLSASAAAGFIGRHAAEVATAPPGRALVIDADGARAVQVAVVDDADIAAVSERWASHPPIESPWLPPLPARIERSELAAIPDAAPHAGSSASSNDRAPRVPALPAVVPALPFGLLDEPSELRQRAALYEPSSGGSLAVTGAPRSGRTTALIALREAALEAAAGVVVLPPSVPDAWQLLEQLAEHPPAATMLLADDLDVLLADAGELGGELVQRWDAAVRAIRRSGGGAAASVGAASSARSVLGSRFESRLLLRAVDADDHQLSGAPRGLFDRAAPPGRGWWHDAAVQVLVAGEGALRPDVVTVPRWVPPAADVLVVARRPAAVAAALAVAHPGYRIERDPGAARGGEEGATVELAPRLIVADPDAWHAVWSAFAAARRSAPVVIAQADAADARALLGLRATLPPLDPEHSDVWVLEPGEGVVRRRWPGLAAG